MNKINQEMLNNLSSSIYNFIDEYCNYSNHYFDNIKIPNLDSVKNILSDKDKGKNFMIDLSELFNFFMFANDFSIPNEEKFFDDLCSIFKEYKNYTNNCKKEFLVDNLAIELVKYARDSNYYEYIDTFENDIDAFEILKNDLFSVSSINGIIEHLCNDISCYAREKDLCDNDILENFKTANDLLVKLNTYSKVLEKQENKEVDIC